MIVPGWLAERLGRWIDDTAVAISALVARVRPVARVTLVETDDGTLVRRGFDGPGPPSGTPAPLQAAISPAVAAAVRGRSVELVLRPERFVFRSLDLPERAADVLDGVVRSQIDRLTPWSLAEAAFGWAGPYPRGDRIAVTVAALARARIQPVVSAIEAAGASDIAVTTMPDGEDYPAQAITVFREDIQGTLRTARWRRRLVAVLATTGAAAALATVLALTLGATFETHRDEALAEIARRRMAARGGEATSEAAALQSRKQTSPARVVALEALSRALPDDTYLTELRVTGETLQIVGRTRDAPALIGLIETSPVFARASFSAPTTRSPGEAGERFSIEARLLPNLSQAR